MVNYTNTSKAERFKQYMKAPPPDSLAKIEYQSHFLNILGTIVVSGILIYNSYWWVIFAFIFSIGVSYSQGVNAYEKYKMIKEYMPKEKLEDYDLDISPTRRRSKIVSNVFGKYSTWCVTVLSILLSMLVYNPLHMVWYKKLAFPFLIFFIYTILYFFVMYWISYPIYKRKIKAVKGGIDI